MSSKIRSVRRDVVKNKMKSVDCKNINKHSNGKSFFANYWRYTPVKYRGENNNGTE